MAAPSVAALQDIATQLRIDSVASTSRAGSGHPTTCLSAADIMAVLFFSEMRFDPKNPQNPDNDRFVLSKGHAAPILYAAWAEAGLFPREQLMELRTFESDLEGHPTPRLPFVDVATGLARTGHLRGDRHRAERAADRLGVSHLRPARRRRDRRGLGLGSRRRGLSLQAGQPLRDRRRQRARPEPGDRVRPRPEPHRRAVDRIRLEGDRRRRPRHRRRPEGTRRGPRDQRSADRARGADAERQGALGDRRKGRVARQGAEER